MNKNNITKSVIKVALGVSISFSIAALNQQVLAHADEISEPTTNQVQPTQEVQESQQPAITDNVEISSKQVEVPTNQPTKLESTQSTEPKQPVAAEAVSSQPTQDNAVTSKVLVQENKNGYWYLVDKTTNQYQTGFQEIKDQNKTVYYNNKGQMQYGQQNINGKWYLFDKSSGAMKYGFQNLKPYGQNKTVYYNNKGQMQYGQQYVNGKWYLFDQVSGAMKTGLQYIKNQNKTVYYNNQGQMQYGQQYLKGHWYLFDKSSGAMKYGFQNLAAYGQNKTVYYNKQGQMQYGQQYINGKWYLFNNGSGAMQIGLKYISNQHKTVLYATDGHMLYGQQLFNGKWYLFDNGSGAMKTGLQYIANQKKTVLYAADGHMLYGQQYLKGHWYLFDKSSGAMKYGFQNLAAYGQNKTVYYNNQGQMQYGQQYINGHWYLFDKATGAMKTGMQWIANQNKTVYYNAQGQMQYGFQTINQKKYYFNPSSGARVQGTQKYISGHWYLFDNNGVIQTGFQVIPSQNKTVYYNEQGQMQYGQVEIGNKTYIFNKSTGALEKTIGRTWQVVDQKTNGKPNTYLTSLSQNQIRKWVATWYLQSQDALGITSQADYTDLMQKMEIKPEYNKVIMIYISDFFKKEGKYVYLGSDGNLYAGEIDANGNPIKKLQLISRKPVELVEK